MSTKQQFSLLFAQKSDQSSKEVIPGSLAALGVPTLEDRVGLFLRAVHGERIFTNEQRADARDRMLSAMAADIVTKPKAEFPRNARLRAPSIGANALEMAGIRAGSAASSRRRSSDNAENPSVRIILDERADLDLEQLAAAHGSNEAGSMATTMNFALLSAQVRAIGERALAASRLSDLRPSWRLVQRGIFVGVPAIAMVIFIYGALHSSWSGKNLDSSIASRDASLAAAQTPPVEELVKRGRELVAAGNMAAGRLVLRQAAEAGSASAALELGATFDPIYLASPSVTTASGGGVPAQSQTVGTVSSELTSAYIVTARAWYEKAKELGAPEAQERLDRLGVVEAKGWEGSHVSTLFQRAGRQWRAQRR